MRGADGSSLPRWAAVGGFAGLVWFHAEMALRLPWLALRTSETAPHGWGVIQLAHVGAGALGAVAVCLASGAARAVWKRSRVAGSAALLLVLAIAGFALARVAGRTELSQSQVAGHVALVLGASVGFVSMCAVALRAWQRHGLRPVAVAGVVAVLVLASWNGFWASRLDLRRLAARLPAPTAPSQLPNVVLLTIDTLRADRVGSFGGPPRLTPNLDRLTREGVAFEAAFAQASWTRPSFGSLMTSLYPSQHGAYVTNDPALGGFHREWSDMLYNGMLAEDVTTAAELFRDAGYVTVAVQSNWQASDALNFDQGFDLFLYEALFHVPLWDRTLLGTYGSWLPAFVGRTRRLPFYTRPPDAEAVHRVVSALFDERAPKPMFLWVNFMDPHSPYLIRDFSRGPEASVVGERDSWDDESDAALIEAYENEVHYVDAWLGSVVEKLEGAGVLGDSILVVASDHGEDFGDHDVVIRFGQQQEVVGRHHGHSLYNELLHVPLILRAPGRLPAGRRVTTTVRLIDVLPTLVALTGVETPAAARFEGESLLPLVTGAETASRPAYAERVYYGLEWKAAIEGADKLVVRPAPAPPERYDLGRDPAENTPLPSQPIALASKLVSWAKRMEEAARAAQGGAVSPVDAGTEEQLRALGYVH